MKLAIGAIFKDEYDYIIEWLAWHKIAGFNDFYIMDNESTDKTTQLLEALEQLGYINLFYQKTLEKNTQIIAYNRIIEKAIGKIDAMLFIDADEFITHDSFIDGKEAEYLKKLLSKPKVGMVGINWRCFGSSGHKKQTKGLVIERFTKCTEKENSGVNQFLKSISKIHLIKSINPHSGKLYDNSIYLNANGQEIDDFILLVNNKFEEVSHSGRKKSISKGNLRVNHYVTKSKEEYIEKKRKRGSAMKGADFDKGLHYFKNHDFKDNTFSFPSKKIEKIKSIIYDIEEELKKTPLYDNLKGEIEVQNTKEIKGWLVNSTRVSKDLKINIFVNNIYYDSIGVGFYREDLKEKKISKDGFSGFKYTFKYPLEVDDTILLKINSNSFYFRDNYKKFNNILNLFKKETFSIVGRIGGVKNNIAIGWAKYDNSNKKVLVELYINNKKVDQKKANEFRPNILEEKKHPTGYCGFSFDLIKYSIKDGDLINAKAFNSNNFLGKDIIYKK